MQLTTEKTLILLNHLAVKKSGVGFSNSSGNSAFGLLAAVNTAYAVKVYRTGFENPLFTTRNLAGQDGWPEVSGLSLNAAQISKLKPRQGKQSVLVRGADLQSDQVIPLSLITTGYL